VQPGFINFLRRAFVRSPTRKNTQEFEILNVLVSYCGQSLTPKLVEKISEEINEVMETTWSFQEPIPSHKDVTAI
jgi:hypothetical protein